MSAPEFIHRFVPGTRAETLLLLHGTGADENDLIPLGEKLLPGAAILSPRGKVLENGMPRFFRRLAEGVFDLEDVKFRAAELAGFASHSANSYGFDPRRLIAAGYSNGANIAAAVLLLHGAIFARAVLFRAMVPLAPENAPGLSNVRVFLGAGREDPIVPGANTEALAALLQGLGAGVTLRWADAGHNLTAGDLDGARRWLEQFPI
jgi:phospholipase/carboxylesterase/glyoxalase family protein